MNKPYRYLVILKESNIFGQKKIKAKSLQSAQMIADTCIHSEIIDIYDTQSGG